MKWCTRSARSRMRRREYQRHSDECDRSPRIWRTARTLQRRLLMRRKRDRLVQCDNYSPLCALGDAVVVTSYLTTKRLIGITRERNIVARSPPYMKQEQVVERHKATFEANRRACVHARHWSRTVHATQKIQLAKTSLWWIGCLAGWNRAWSWQRR